MKSSKNQCNLNDQNDSAAVGVSRNIEYMNEKIIENCMS